MSATDELRRMLDERSVKWEKGASLTSMYTYWTDCNGHDVTAVGTNNAMFMSHFVTPQQAIDATLGRGECEVEYVSDWMGWHCKSCDALWQGLKDQPPRFCKECGRQVKR